MIRICTLLSLLLALPLPAQDLRHVSHFCPECWSFAPDDGEWSRDEAGRCWTCGRPPVELEAAILRWWWCARQSAWLRSPCAESARASCCTPQDVRTAVVLSGEPAERARYCPECRSFETLDSVPIRCRDCGRPPARVEVVIRAWTWCRTSRAWREGPCAADAVEACCLERSGRILAARFP